MLTRLPPTHGYEATRDAAMAAFAKNWRRECLGGSLHAWGNSDNRGYATSYWAGLSPSPSRSRSPWATVCLLSPLSVTAILPMVRLPASTLEHGRLIARRGWVSTAKT
jgi:hypothetical protein